MRTVVIGIVPAILLIGLIAGALKLKSYMHWGGRTCEVDQCPLVIHDTDTGKRFIYRHTARFTLYLNDEKNPKDHLRCDPEGIIGAVSSIPETQPPFYSAVFEGVATGTCVLRTDNFAARIVIL